MKCPFVYADGRKCAGEIYRARAYGRGSYGVVEAEDVRKIRLWCSEKNDHEGAVSSFAGKLRMEFYPDELHQLSVYAEALALCENVPENSSPTT
jgi:hypothetical protein